MRTDIIPYYIMAGVVAIVLLLIILIIFIPDLFYRETDIKPEQIRTIRMSYDSPVNFQITLDRWLSQDHEVKTYNADSTVLTIERSRPIYKDIYRYNDSLAIIIYTLEPK